MLTNALVPLLVVCLCAGTSLASSTKTARTYYTPERLASMRENLDRYEWAQTERDAIIKRADQWLAYSDEDLRMMVPPPELPRAGYVNGTDCPVHGLEVRKFGTYGWKVSLDQPFKVTCPVGGEVYPDNDFAAYYRSGWDGRRWDPERADRALLTGGEMVDDGWGWDSGDGTGRKYWFVAYYTQWVLVRQVVWGVLEDCSRAYLLTEDPRYAHATAVVLWQLAEYYPDYRFEKQSRHGLEIDPRYWGKLLYHTWECWTVEHSAKAYDAIFPALAGDTALQQAVGQSAPEVAEHIESRMLRDMARLIIDGSHTIQGNYGMHQTALLYVALACGDEVNEPRKSQMIDWIVNNENSGALYTDLSLNDALYNVVYRDGTPFESPSYNLGWVDNLTLLAGLLAECGEDVLAHPRLKAICDWPLELICAGQFTPSLGDSGRPYHFKTSLSGAVAARAFRLWRDPRYAKVVAEATSAYGRDLFERQVDEEALEAAREVPEPLGISDSILPAYGMTILQTGTDANRSAVAFNQGADRSAHAHYDAMSIDIYSRGNSLIPDFGYPETANSDDPRRFGWFSHSAAHNIVQVNARRAARAHAAVTNYDPFPSCRIVDARSDSIYPGVTDLYRRTTALVDATADDHYVLDIFRVSGGEQHDWIVHGTDATFATALPLSPPREGTLAGPDVPYGHFYDDEALRDAPYGTVSYVRYEGSAYQWLRNVQEGALDGAGVVEWHVARTAEQPPSFPHEGISLRAHLIGDDETLFVCDGEPQQNALMNPATMKFVVRRRTGEDLRSTFITVFEPTQDQPFLRSVERVEATPAEADPVALRITRADGGVDWFVSTSDASATVQVEGGPTLQGEAAFISLTADGAIRRARLSNGSLLRFGEVELVAPGMQTLTIEAIDYARGIVTLAEGAALNETHEGQWIVTGSEQRRSLFRIDRVLDERRFSIEEQDPRTGRLMPATWNAEARLLTTTNSAYYMVRPGMHVADESYRVIGQVASVPGSTSLELAEGASLELETLPDTDGDGRRRLWLLELAPGATVTLPSRAALEATADGG